MTSPPSFRSALLLCGLLVIFGAIGVYKRNEAHRFSGYEEVVALIKEGKLRVNSSGEFVLPHEWVWLTKNGHVYQTYNKQSGLVLLFPTEVEEHRVDWGEGKIEKTRDIAGYVYCLGPLPDDGWFTFPGMNGIGVWNKRNPVRPHWYYVEPFYS